MKNFFKFFLSIFLVFLGFSFVHSSAFADQNFTAANYSYNPTNHELIFDITNPPASFDSGSIIGIRVRDNIYFDTLWYNFSGNNCNFFTHCDVIVNENHHGFVGNITIYFITQNNVPILQSQPIDWYVLSNTIPPSPSPTPVPDPLTIFQDNFHDINGITLPQHNSNWVLNLNAPTPSPVLDAIIENNQLFYYQSNLFWYDLPAFQSTADQCATVNMYYDPVYGDDAFYLIVRRHLTDTTINTEDQGGYLVFHSNSLDLIDGKSGRDVSIGTDSYQTISPKNYTICAIGQTLTAYIDGNQVGEIDNTAMNTTGTAAIVGVNWNNAQPPLEINSFTFDSGFIPGGTPTPTPTPTPIPNQPPVVNSLSNITISEGNTLTQQGSFTDSDSTSWTATVDYGDGSGIQSISLNPDKSFSLSHKYLEEGVYTARVTVADNQGLTGQASLTVTVNDSNPTVSIPSPSINPVQINTPVTFSSTFTDPGTSDIYTASWNWGDGSAVQNGTITQQSGSTPGNVTDAHAYTNPGVYAVTLTVTDADGGSATQVFQYLSVYNPTSQGVFSGGSKFTSPVGAYIANPTLTGDVKFGLSYKYQGAMPVGDKQFALTFKAANITFNATNVTSLVIANGIGTLTGTGTINGSGGYNFLVTGSETNNTIRIQITDQSNNVIYDTQPGASTTASPTTPVSGHVLAH